MKNQKTGTNGSTGSNGTKEAGHKNKTSLLEKFFVDQLKDMYYAEQHLVKALPEMKSAATSEELEDAFDDHLKQTERHVKRLEKVFKLLKQKPEGKKCEAIEGLTKEAKSIISETREAHEFGIDFGTPKIDKTKLLAWKGKVVAQMSGGLKGLAKQRKVDIVHGTGKFISANQLGVETAEGVKTIGFGKAIIAAGSQPVKLPFLPDDPRIIDSTGALQLENIPKRIIF